MPKKPTGMSKPASAMWDEIGPELLRVGTLTLVDGQAFFQYCETAALEARLQREVNRLKSLTQKAPSGYDQIHPLVAQLNRTREDLDRFHRKFGITAGVRGDEGVPVAQPTTGRAHDDAKEFFGRRASPRQVPADVPDPSGPIPLRPRAGGSRL